MHKAAACGVLFLAMGTAAMSAQDGAGAPDAQQSQDGQGGGGGRGRRGGGMGRGMGMGGGVPVMGTVTAVSATAIQVKTDTGAAATIDTTANTRYMKDRQPIDAGTLKVGDAVVAMGMTDPSTNEMHAAMVNVLTPEEATQAAARAKEMREAMGKTIIAGRIEKIEEAKLTVMRPDGVEQVIQADENTSFRRGGRGGMGRGFGGDNGGGSNNAGGGQQAPQGESITMADIKVGDNVTGRGTLKSGIFTLTTLNVMQPRGRMRGQQQQDDTRQ